MVDRSYLPFKSAREYKDSKMAKWGGFFLTEHIDRLSNGEYIDREKYNMDTYELILLINSSFIHNLPILLYIKDNKKAYTTRICDIFEDRIYFKTEDKILSTSFNDIEMIKILEEEDEDRI